MSLEHFFFRGRTDIIRPGVLFMDFFPANWNMFYIYVKHIIQNNSHEAFRNGDQSKRKSISKSFSYFVFVCNCKYFEKERKPNKYELMCIVGLK